MLKIGEKQPDIISLCNACFPEEHDQCHVIINQVRCINQISEKIIIIKGKITASGSENILLTKLLLNAKSLP